MFSEQFLSQWVHHLKLMDRVLGQFVWAVAGLLGAEVKLWGLESGAEGGSGHAAEETVVLAEACDRIAALAGADLRSSHRAGLPAHMVNRLLFVQFALEAELLH